MKKVILFNDQIENFSFDNKIVNKSLVDFPLMACEKAGVKDVLLIGEGEDHDRRFSYTSEDDLIEGLNDDDFLLFFYINMPFVTGKMITRAFDRLESDKLDALVAQAETKSALYAIKADRLKEELEKSGNKTLEEVLYSIDLQEKRTKLMRVKSSKKLYQVKDMLSLSKADSMMRKSINKEFLEKGVFIESPETVTIEPGVKIGSNTRIESGVRILGKTRIGKNCNIGFNSKIEDSIIHDNVDVYTSFIEKSEVEAYTNIGPFARLRPNSHLKEHVHIGNFVEVKNSTVGNGTKAGHLAYIGDADLGEDINVSCGVIFANYDGKFKHRSKVEDGAFIGSNVNIVSPVHVAKEGYIAAGSTVTKDVGPGYLVVERAERKDIEGYVEKKKQRDKLKEEAKK